VFSFWDFTPGPHTVADPGFAQKGDRGERADLEPKRESGGGAPSGVQGQSPGEGFRRLRPEAYSFLSIFIQKVAKVKDLNENLSGFASVSETDCFAYLRPALSFGQWEGVRSAHSWIRHYPHGSATVPHFGLPQTPVLSTKTNSCLYIRPCLSLSLVRSLKHLLYGKCCTAVTTTADSNIIYIESVERQLPTELS